MDYVKHLLAVQPLIALFITIALGYFVGKLKLGKFLYSAASPAPCWSALSSVSSVSK